jgi:hypothetical protein
VPSRLGGRISTLRAVILLLSIVYALQAQAQTNAYRVYFDWDRTALNSQAYHTIQAAASAARESYARVIVSGFTDTSGTMPYNQSLSLRRAQIVAAELGREGVPQAAINIQANGGHYLPTPTSLNVREPQNRSVDILVQASTPAIVAVRPPPPFPYAFPPSMYGFREWGWYPWHYHTSDANDLR